MTGPVPQVEPIALWNRLERGDDVVVIDVREPWEVQRASVHGSTSIPLGDLPDAASSLDPSREYIVLCHHGMRSELAAEWMRNHGFERVSNLDGGIDAWSRMVDPSIPRY